MVFLFKSLGFIERRTSKQIIVMKLEFFARRIYRITVVVRE